MSLIKKHGAIERNASLLLVLSLMVVSIGGIIEIAPLFYFQNTIEKVKGMRPYTPLELSGRNIYIREGCYLCHSQMIRPFRDEVERYGQYSLAAESMYDHPFQWGSKRTGPDLARVGGRYSNEWQVQHLTDPRSLVPESIMPKYGFLAKTKLSFDDMDRHLRTNQLVGVPYTAEQVENAKADVIAQASTDADIEGLQARYTYDDRFSVPLGDFDGNPDEITEMDALVAYLQMLGTLVDFSSYVPEANYR
jgi:cytochrome c oxidase cbb3-type subunit 2